MIQVKKSIICITILMAYVCNFYTIHAQIPVSSIVHEFIWADHSRQHDSFAHTIFRSPTGIDRNQAVYTIQNNLRILLSQSYPIYCEKYILPALPHDCNLIEKICADNLHYDQKKLVSKLAHHKHINQMSSYLKSSDEFLYTLDENIIIDLEHFKALPHAQKRINDYVEVANEIRFSS